MLVNFSCSNFRSIREKVTLDMTISKMSEKDPLCKQNCIQSEALFGAPISKSAVVYGANASGKTNLIRAIQFMRHYVITSAKEFSSGDTTGVIPFLLDKENHDLPSEFEITLLSDDVKYRYGYQLSEYCVVKEWLYSYPEGRPRKLFQRELSDTEYGYKYSFSSYFKAKRGEKDNLRNMTRENSLFLTVSAQFNNSSVLPVFKWFKDKLRFIFMQEEPFEFSSQMFRQDDIARKFILGFLTSADIGISNITFEKKHYLHKIKDAPEPLRESLKDIVMYAKNRLKESETGEMQVDDESYYEIYSTHKAIGKEGDVETVKLPFDMESGGTIKLFSISGPLLDCLVKDRVLIIDELDSNMHPHLSKFFYDLFSRMNKHGRSQLIFTTHNTHFLSSDDFLRDQIWFIEKNEKEESVLYSLLDYKPRKNEAFEKGYLAGRYGATPFIDDYQLNRLIALIKPKTSENVGQ